MRFLAILILTALACTDTPLLAQGLTARDVRQDSIETPTWTNPKGFEKDVFTFVRIRYGTGGRGRRFHPYGRKRWATDFPDADLNLSYRLQQMTSMKVDPSGRVLEI